MIYREVYEEGKKRLIGAGIEEAALDARLLLEFICGTDHNALLVHGDEQVQSAKTDFYWNAINRRSQHVPLQYITGCQEFMGLSFLTHDAVLIPRQDTETLVEEALRHLHDGMKILDLCTGSGCILLSLLHYSNHSKGTGIDISEDAISNAKKNAQAFGITADFLLGDLWEPIHEKYDLIVSNPPYIESNVIDSLMSEVKDYEPRIALDGGSDGLDFYRRIAEGANEYLCGGGWLLLEVGSNQAEMVAEMLRQADYRNVSIQCDLAGCERVVSGCYWG